MTEMTWEQKLAALQCLTDTSLRMRSPGDWYVSAYSRAIGGDGLLTSAYGNGASPEQAVNDDWSQMTSLPADKYIVVNANGPEERCYRWLGFMWDCQGRRIQSKKSSD